MNKFFLILKIIFFSNYSFKKPENKSIVLFDGEGSEYLFNIFKGFEYFVLEVRPNRIRKIYLNIEIIFLTLKNLKYKIGIYNAYLLGILDLINPKIVFTYIDNSYKFSQLAQLRKNNFNFIAFQNGARYEHNILDELFRKKLLKKKFKFTIPNFFCFGDYEINEYKRLNYNVDNFVKIGSLKLANYLNKIKNKKRKLFKKKNIDILLISDAYCWDKILNNLNMPVEEGVGNLIKFTIKYAIKNKINFKLATRNFKKNFRVENQFYKKILTKKEFNFLSKNFIFRGDMFKIYDTMLKSNVVIGTMSTTLRENLSLGRKTLVCNFTRTKVFDFPIKGICFLKKDNYQVFEKRLNQILKISNRRFLKSLTKSPKYLVSNFGIKTFDLFKSKIKFFL